MVNMPHGLCERVGSVVRGCFECVAREREGRRDLVSYNIVVSYNMSVRCNWWPLFTFRTGSWERRWMFKSLRSHQVHPTGTLAQLGSLPPAPNVPSISKPPSIPRVYRTCVWTARIVTAMILIGVVAAAVVVLISPRHRSRRVAPATATTTSRTIAPRDLSALLEQASRFVASTAYRWISLLAKISAI